jgi:hypothetical protein
VASRECSSRRLKQRRQSFAISCLSLLGSGLQLHFARKWMPSQAAWQWRERREAEHVMGQVLKFVRPDANFDPEMAMMLGEASTR